ncbi:MAG: NADP-dependent methylenetetrahydromethanopterin/methylenetetrahydrofolate dehydrogenase [Isosphaeraceae bacterium]|nr:NADP-dependent methylenetetrahydromethanopterin/methylenetetrahydrofolate dehydrogenase [Isosphaeraceae bacterium]
MSTEKPTILIQLDADPQPSVFDGVVAVDAGVQHLFRHGGVTPEKVKDLIFGAMFTRGFSDLKSTAVFVGGSDVAAGEALFEAVKSTFFGPFRVSAILDANGCNTTAAAAVLAAIEGAGGSVEGVRAAVLGGTGPVGRRVARLLARQGARVSIGSRRLDRARDAAESLSATVGARVDAFETGDDASLSAGLADVAVVVASGTTGACLLPYAVRSKLERLRVLIDLNAVPPLGIEGVEANDKAVERQGIRCWGALGVGGTKMKIHRAAVRALFTANDRVLDAEEIFEMGRALA